MSLLELVFSEPPVPEPPLSDAGSFFEDESLLEPLPLEPLPLELSPLEPSPLEPSPLEPSPLELSAVFLPEPLPAEAARESFL